MSAPAARVAHGDPAEHLECRVVVHAAVADDAAVAVVGVFAAADVGDEEEIGMPLAETPQRLLHDAIFGEVLPTDRILRLREYRTG